MVCQLHWPAFISRVFNAQVLSSMGQGELGQHLLREQLLLCVKVARAPASDPLRRLAFVPGTIHPATARFVRRVGSSSERMGGHAPEGGI